MDSKQRTGRWGVVRNVYATLAALVAAAGGVPDMWPGLGGGTALGLATYFGSLAALGIGCVHADYRDQNARSKAEDRAADELRQEHRIEFARLRFLITARNELEGTQVVDDEAARFDSRLYGRLLQHLDSHITAIENDDDTIEVDFAGLPPEVERFLRHVMGHPPLTFADARESAEELKAYVLRAERGEFKLIGGKATMTHRDKDGNVVDEV